MPHNVNILLIDDDKTSLKNIESITKKEGYHTAATQSGQNALRLLEERRFDVVVTGSRVGKISGIQILKKCRELHADTEIIIISASATLNSAVETMKQGAFHYMSKSFTTEELRRIVTEAVAKVRLKQEKLLVREQIENHHEKIRIISQDTAMQRLLETARQIAPTDCNVLISGESGTGKELFAKFIHYNSSRAKGPFFAVNCGAFSEELLANELFGHAKGAFTGASSAKKGLIEAAARGTLFLDEIAEMPASMQVKLLRAIQEKEVLPLGTTSRVKVDVRFIAATNRDIGDAIKTGDFRQDLYFRLNVVSLYIPPLADRKEDIAILSYFFLNKYSAIMKKQVNEISQDVIALLINYDFPGNVRELENIIERGVALSNGPSIEIAHLPDDLREMNIRTFRKKHGKIPTLEEQELTYIKWVMGETGGNKTLAADILGIDRVSLWRKLKKYGLESFQA